LSHLRGRGGRRRAEPQHSPKTNRPTPLMARYSSGAFRSCIGLPKASGPSSPTPCPIQSTTTAPRPPRRRRCSLQIARTRRPGRMRFTCWKQAPALLCSRDISSTSSGICAVATVATSTIGSCPCHRSVGAQRPAVERLRGPGRTRCTRHNYRLRRRDPGARHRTTAPRGVRQLRVRLAAGRRAAADGGDVAAVVRPRDRSRRCRQRDGFHTHHPEWRKLGGA
jgi:hypothetical protein